MKMPCKIGKYVYYIECEKDSSVVDSFPKKDITFINGKFYYIEKEKVDAFIINGEGVFPAKCNKDNTYSIIEPFHLSSSYITEEEKRLDIFTQTKYFYSRKSLNNCIRSLNE